MEQDNKSGGTLTELQTTQTLASSSRSLRPDVEVTTIVEAVEYRTYKRRWFGLLQLVLLNIVVSWDWLTFSPVVNDAAVFFSTTPSTVNWFSTAFFFAFVIGAPFSLYALYHSGPRLALIVSSILVLLGNWIRYAGVRVSPPSYAAVMVGQIFTGLAQPFVLSAPTRYSELWFTPRGRVTATAVASLANPFGGAVGQLVNPSFIAAPSDIASMVLYVAIISSVAALPSFFVPANPPTPVAPSSARDKPKFGTQLSLLARSTTFWLIFVPFAVYVGLFNSLSSLLTQMLTPYGYSQTEAGIAGALLILVGLVTAAVLSPIIDRSKEFITVIRVFVPIIAVCYLTFIWAPPAKTLAAPYLICSVLGGASFALMPVALESVVEVTWPVGPEFTSVICWTGGQLLGALFVIISDALEDDSPDADPSGNLRKALIFQAVIAAAVVPCSVIIGRLGSVQARRLAIDQSYHRVDGG